MKMDVRKLNEIETELCNDTLYKAGLHVVGGSFSKTDNTYQISVENKRNMTSSFNNEKVTNQLIKLLGKNVVLS